MAAVTLTVVGNEMEAEVLCGSLRANGIPCDYRKTNVAGVWTLGTSAGGPIEILVDESDLVAARAFIDGD